MGKWKLYPAVACTLLMLAACVSSAVRRAVPEPVVPTTEASCLARGGQWTTLGLPMPDKPKMCDLRASDEGQPCTDTSECQGECLAPSSAFDGVQATGRCSAFLANFGDVLRVSHGKVEPINVE